MNENQQSENVDSRLQREVNRLVDIYRARCLWFLRADYYPQTREEIRRTLQYIKRYGDRKAFREAGALSRCL